MKTKLLKFLYVFYPIFKKRILHITATFSSCIAYATAAIKTKDHVILFNLDDCGWTINLSPWILVPAAKFFRTSSIPIVGYSVFYFLSIG
jgi:hypothetical protein